MSRQTPEFKNKDSYNLLDELLSDDYDKFEEFKNEHTGCNNDLKKTPQTKIQEENYAFKNKTNSSVLETEKKQHVIVNNKLDIEDGEIIDNSLSHVEITPELGPVEITSMFNRDKMLVRAFHDRFQKKHLILKIYENCSSCPFCKLIHQK